jgi:ketosteroid isomerase-like protein
MMVIDEDTVAVFLGDVVERGMRNRLDETAHPHVDGAHAALETFYHAFNTRTLDLFRQIWVDDPFIQLNNPVGGIVRGAGEIAALYARIFEGPVRVRVELWDIVRYAAPGVVVFAGRERGTYERDGHAEPLDIRTTRIFRYIDGQGWRQLHHHGSIDDAGRLAQYQRAVRDA